jgi:hypothetical protein
MLDDCIGVIETRSSPNASRPHVRDHVRRVRDRAEMRIKEALRGDAGLACC